MSPTLFEIAPPRDPSQYSAMQQRMESFNIGRLTVVRANDGHELGTVEMEGKHRAWLSVSLVEPLSQDNPTDRYIALSWTFDNPIRPGQQG